MNAKQDAVAFMPYIAGPSNVLVRHWFDSAVHGACAFGSRV